MSRMTRFAAWILMTMLLATAAASGQAVRVISTFDEMSGPGAMFPRSGVLVAASDAPAAAKQAAGAAWTCDGNDDEVQIQAAMEYIRGTLGGGNLYLSAGTFTCGGSIQLRSGVSIIGVRPGIVEASSSANPDAGWGYMSGTVLSGEGGTAGSVTVLGWDPSGGCVLGITIQDIAIDSCKAAMNVGEPNQYGLAFSRIQDVYVSKCDPSTSAVLLTNIQHVRVDHLKIFDVGRGVEVVADRPVDGADIGPANCVFTDVYVQTYAASPLASGGGIRVEAKNYAPLNFMTWIRPQVNMWGNLTDGVALYVKGASTTWTVYGCDFIDCDLEGEYATAIYAEYCYKTTFGIRKCETANTTTPGAYCNPGITLIHSPYCYVESHENALLVEYDSSYETAMFMGRLAMFSERLPNWPLTGVEYERAPSGAPYRLIEPNGWMYDNRSSYHQVYVQSGTGVTKGWYTGYKSGTGTFVLSSSIADANASDVVVSRIEPMYYPPGLWVGNLDGGSPKLHLTMPVAGLVVDRGTIDVPDYSAVRFSGYRITADANVGARASNTILCTLAGDQEVQLPLMTAWAGAEVTVKHDSTSGIKRVIASPYGSEFVETGGTGWLYGRGDSATFRSSGGGTWNVIAEIDRGATTWGTFAASGTIDPGKRRVRFTGAITLTMPPTTGGLDGKAVWIMDPNGPFGDGCTVAPNAGQVIMGNTAIGQGYGYPSAVYIFEATGGTWYQAAWDTPAE